MAHTYDELFKGANHKYIRRIPTGNPKRPWKYIYDVASESSTRREAERGEKVRITEGARAGHYEVKDVHPNGWITIKHDETGTELALKKSQFQQLFFEEHAEKADEYRRKAKEALEKAIEKGSKAQITRIKNRLAKFNERFPDPAAAALKLQALDLTAIAEKTKTAAAHGAASSALTRAARAGAQGEDKLRKLAVQQRKKAQKIKRKKAKKPTGQFGTKASSYAAVMESIGEIPPDFVAADQRYKAWKGEAERGGSKPKPWTGGELDAANEALNLQKPTSKRPGKDKRVSSPRHAWDLLTAGVKSWNDPRVFEALAVMRQIPGFEKMELPPEVTEWITSQAAKDEEEETARYLAEKEREREAMDQDREDDEDLDDSFDFGWNVADEEGDDSFDFGFNVTRDKKLAASLTAPKNPNEYARVEEIQKAFSTRFHISEGQMLEKLLEKARGPVKYKRRWRGKDGRYQYEYDEPKTARTARMSTETAETREDAPVQIKRLEGEALEEALIGAGDELYRLQAGRSGKKDDIGFSSSDMQQWKKARGNVRYMQRVLRGYKRQLGGETHYKLGLDKAAEGTAFRGEVSPHGDVYLPADGALRKFDAMLKVNRNYRSAGLMYNGDRRCSFVPWDKVQSFPFEEYASAMEEATGMSVHSPGGEWPPKKALEIIERKRADENQRAEEAKRLREQGSEEAPKGLANEMIRKIRDRQVTDTIVVKHYPEGVPGEIQPGGFAIFSDFNRKFNDLVSNKNDHIQGIFDVRKELGWARVTYELGVVEDFVEKAKAWFPNHTFVIEGLEDYQREEQKRQAELRQPLPELVDKLAINPDTGRPFELFPYQNEGVKFLLEKDGKAIIGDDMGLGKEQPVSEPILTPNGWVRMGNIQNGDWVIGSNGEPVKVTGVYPQGVRSIYRITFADGAYAYAGEEHLWTVRPPGGSWETLSTRELMDRGLYDGAGNQKFQIPMVEPIRMEAHREEIDPYALGVYLGDGNSNNAVRISTDPRVGPWKESLTRYGLSKCAQDKFVPDVFLHGNAAQRLALLQGLLDTDGSPIQGGGVEFSSTSRRLIRNVQWLAESLGGVARRSKARVTEYTHNGEKRSGRPSWRVNVKLPPQFDPFRLPSKLEKWERPTYFPNRPIASIEYSHEEEAQCIRVESPDRLYVTRHCVLTHNTLQALAYGAAANKKMLAVGPKVVRSQWIDEARRFFPDHYQGVALSTSDLNKAKKNLAKHRATYEKKHGRSGTEVEVIREALGINDANLISVNYEALAKLRPYLDDAGIESLVVDESHRVKSPTAKITKLLTDMSKNIGSRILMSGTAIKNRKEELFTQINMVRPGLYRTAGDLKFSTHGSTRTKLREIYIARRKKDVLKDLPPKVRSPISMEMPTVPDIPERLDIGMISRLKDDVAQAKAKYTADFVTDYLKDGGSKVIVFSDSTSAVNEIQSKLGDKAVKYMGSVSDDNRKKAIDAFRDPDSKVQVLVATTASMGVGLNLSNAETVVFNDLPWTVADQMQAEDRAHRANTQHTVNVHAMLAEGNMWDELITETLDKKRRIMQLILDGKPVSKEQQQWAKTGLTPEAIKRFIENRGKQPPTAPNEPEATQAPEPAPKPKPEPKPEPKRAPKAAPKPTPRVVPKGKAAPKRQRRSQTPPAQLSLFKALRQEMGERFHIRVG